MSVKILGISCYYHDSAAALLDDGKIIAAAQEERFSRKKHDPAFPTQAIVFCLNKAGISLADVDYVVFYEKPLIKFERLLETYLSYAPGGIRSFIAAMPVWLKDKLFLKQSIRNELSALSSLKVNQLPVLLFTEHHQSHAASAFFPSPFTKAAILCADGVGEWATTSVWLGEDKRLTPVWEIDFPHSLGLLYSAFTYYSGFKVNSGEYKLMGLAPYGVPRYTNLIYDKLIDSKPDGSFRLDMRYFNYAAGLTMTNHRFHQLFGGPPRKPETEITQKHMDMASSIQTVTEELVLKICRTIKEKTNSENLCLAGGVALNCVANGRILREKIFDSIWIQPAAGDSGGAIGAAFSVWHEYLGESHTKPGNMDLMRGAFLGPGFSNSEICHSLDNIGAKYIVMEDEELLPKVAELLAHGSVAGWFQGPMEFGPRALGGRSIIGDPRNPQMQSIMNLKIKNRESFRPFAPSVKEERLADWFECDVDSPYMLIVAEVRADKRLGVTKESEEMLTGLRKLNVTRSQLPAITHVDYSARIQTVHRKTNPRYWALIDAFENLTGCPVLINTSFNVRGEPIVCTPEDAYRCFMRTEMDCLIMENVMLFKQDQEPIRNDNDWKQEFAPD
jgi:carbamoyltransferase